jgi:hypothetical protein
MKALVHLESFRRESLNLNLRRFNARLLRGRRMLCKIEAGRTKAKLPVSLVRSACSGEASVLKWVIAFS